ncbi:MAG: hypothetical protein GQ581_11115 [Methyloprofundus sp.]|nr:hypothetical protein [Methyloprofundus sp.]
MDISKQQIQSIPEQLLSELNDAATSLDVEQCLMIIAQIKAIDIDLADNLQHLVEKFNFQVLLEKVKL